MTILSHIKHTVTLIHEGKTVTYTHAGKGFEYLEEVLAHPHQPIRPTYLRQLFTIDTQVTAQAEYTEKQPVTVPFCDHFPFLPLESPIEAADQQTIKEVKQALIDLLSEEAEAMQHHDLARIEDIRDEKAQLMQYLSTVLSPQRRPRYLSHPVRNDYSAVKQAIKRALAKLQKDFPELTTDLNAHLDYGLLICYHPTSPNMQI
jgi:hypothetical protein